MANQKCRCLLMCAFLSFLQYEQRDPKIEKLMGAYPSFFSCCSGDHTVLRHSYRQSPKASGPNRFFKNEQGLWLRWRLWKNQPSSAPDTVPASPRGVIILVHGFGEHIDRYDTLAALFVQKGFLVAGLDHQGHGQSEGDRAFVVAFSDYVADVVQFIEEVQDEVMVGSEGATPPPLFLFGHSMGGLISSILLTDHQHLFRAAILSAPAVDVDPSVATPTKRFLAAKLSACCPKLALDKIDPTGISRDAAEVKKYVEDPLVYHDGVQVRFGNEMLNAIDNFWTKASKITLPFLIVHGTADKLCPIGGSERLFTSVSTAADRKIFKRYEGFYHELFRDLGKEAVLDDLCQFLEEQTK